MEFHISREARSKYNLSDTLFSHNGYVMFADTRAVREFTEAINKYNNTALYPEKTVQASQIFAMGLIDEIFRYVIELYNKQVNLNVFQNLNEFLNASLSSIKVDQTLATFINEFPPSEIFKNKISIQEYLSKNTNGQPNIYVTLEELLLLSLTNNNPACMRYSELFDDAILEKTSSYADVMTITTKYFRHQPSFGPENLDLLSMLRKPAEVSPNSLAGQLEYIRNNWGFLLGEFLSRILGGLDFIKEETKISFGGGGPGPMVIPDYKSIGRMLDLESENFSPDRDWMPSLVLMAKNSYVWLYQLSKKYNCPLTRLDEIPDEELDFLAHSGFTGLWLIGLWQRSKASERIKRLCGNPEAVASAYSIDSYRIADDLGGEEAFNQLRDRAWRRGIRLASDMVPNHFGIDSSWVLYKPDNFLSLNYCPFPSYSFNGENLSPDPAIGIHLEDHYYSRSDASVVFKREDFHTGDIRYIYHGNDGTVMPWNDTAQLNYLMPEVREAVIQIILDVARRTPIIRFDAAMTLAKKHIQRLWFPEPGSGGAIPTRSEHGISKDDFDRLLPEEFWREVVDRVAREVPDTLLLAEAFWLMEGYFVRTLGMHRVYNSAFMHMLRNEDNANFKTLIKNTLEFDPDILKRYVNFVNNPDEKTAIEQFGDGDKYFGVCTVLATLPGLPMFGHGQLEGFSEKYGMEYRRAYMDEEVNEGLLNHHEQAIFPLLRHRHHFSGSNNFRLYDYYLPDGQVNDDVIAYSNDHNGYRSLVLFNNKFKDTKGWINSASQFLQKGDGGSRIIIDRLAAKLGCSGQNDRFLIFKELNSGLTYIRESVDVAQNGLFFDLHAFEHRVFFEFFEVTEDSTTHYQEICTRLAGRGVPDIFAEIKRLQIHPFIESLHSACNQNIIVDLAKVINSLKRRNVRIFFEENKLVFENLNLHFHAIYHWNRNDSIFINDLQDFVEDIIRFIKLSSTHPTISDPIRQMIARALTGNDLPAIWIWMLVTSLEKTSRSGVGDMEEYYDNWMLDEFFEHYGNKDHLTRLLKQLMCGGQDIPPNTHLWADYFITSLQRKSLQTMLGINRSGGSIWFNRESMENWFNIRYTQLVLKLIHQPSDTNRRLESTVLMAQKLGLIKKAITKSEYKFDEFLDLIKKI